MLGISAALELYSRFCSLDLVFDNSRLLSRRACAASIHGLHAGFAWRLHAEGHLRADARGSGSFLALV